MIGVHEAFPIQVTANDSRLVQDQLISHAVDYTDRQKQTVSITTNLSTRDG